MEESKRIVEWTEIVEDGEGRVDRGILGTKRYLSGSKSRDRPPLGGYALTEKRLAKINGIHIEQGASVEYSCHRVGANIGGSRAQRGDGGGRRQTKLVPRTEGQNAP